MSIRDFFAAAALQGLLAAEVHPKAMGFPQSGVEINATFAHSAYLLADAMLKAREQ